MELRPVRQLFALSLPEMFSHSLIVVDTSLASQPGSSSSSSLRRPNMAATTASKPDYLPRFPAHPFMERYFYFSLFLMNHSSNKQLNLLMVSSAVLSHNSFFNAQEHATKADCHKHTALTAKHHSNITQGMPSEKFNRYVMCHAGKKKKLNVAAVPPVPHTNTCLSL